MVDNNKIIFPKHVNLTLSKTTISLSTFFYSKISSNTEEDQIEALHWLETILKRKNLMTRTERLLIKEILIPINFNNNHWILVTIDLKHHCYFTINPYHPEQPTLFELSIASFILDTFKKI